MTDATRPLAVVTGGSRRVGRAVVIELAAAGFDVAITCRSRSPDTEETLRLALRAGAREVLVHEADLTNPAAVEELGRTLARRSRVDALIHNASMYEPTPWGAITASQAIEHFRVNALAPLLLTQALAARLGQSPLRGGGSVICFGDMHIMGRPRQGFLPYAMSKAALHELVRGLARQLAPRVRVNGIAPGVIAWPEQTPAAERAAYESRIPLARSGTPEEAASLVRWLICEAGYITGEIIRLDGGRWLR